jgi:hypothetical protein
MTSERTTLPTGSAGDDLERYFRLQDKMTSLGERLNEQRKHVAEKLNSARMSALERANRELGGLLDVVPRDRRLLELFLESGNDKLVNIACCLLDGLFIEDESLTIRLINIITHHPNLRTRAHALRRLCERAAHYGVSKCTDVVKAAREDIHELQRESEFTLALLEGDTDRLLAIGNEIIRKSEERKARNVGCDPGQSSGPP